MIRSLMVLGLLVAANLVHAREAAATAEGTVPTFAGLPFFAALVVGFVLAMAFQAVLTNLSIAAGVTAAKPLTSPKPHSPPETKGKQEKGTVLGTVRTVTAGYGIWTLITASLALFFACWLAVKLSLSTSNMIGAVLGLGIWGLFYMAMTSLEVSAVSSLVGSLAHTATSGLRSIKESATSLFSSSAENRAADAAAKVVSAVREELFGDAEDSRKQMHQFIQELKPQPIDPKQIREELAKLFNETEIRAMTVHDDKLDRDKLVYTLHSKYGSTEWLAEAAQGVKGAASTVKEELRSDKPAAEKALDAGMRLAGLSKEDAQELRQKWEDYLRRTGKQELNPDNIKREVEMLFSNPQVAKEALKTRVAEVFNKSTITALLAQRTDMTPEEAEKTVGWIDQVIQQIRQKGDGAQKSLEDVRGEAVAKVRDYLNSLNRPELKYEGLRDDLSKLFHDPKAGAESLINRLKSMDRESLKAILASRKDMSPEDAEHILNQIESKRDEMVRKAEAMKAEVERRLNQAKEEALRQAEEARKTAATAAWWSFVTAVGSGAAAVAGALLAIPK
jgi:hypothetical protein